MICIPIPVLALRRSPWSRCGRQYALGRLKAGSPCERDCTPPSTHTPSGNWNRRGSRAAVAGQLDSCPRHWTEPNDHKETAIVRLVCSAVGGEVRSVSVYRVEWVEVNNSQPTTLPNGSNRGALIHRGLDRGRIRQITGSAEEAFILSWLQRRVWNREYKGHLYTLGCVTFTNQLIRPHCWRFSTPNCMLLYSML